MWCERLSQTLIFIMFWHKGGRISSPSISVSPYSISSFDAAYLKDSNRTPCWPYKRDTIRAQCTTGLRWFQYLWFTSDWSSLECWSRTVLSSQRCISHLASFTLSQEGSTRSISFFGWLRSSFCRPLGIFPFQDPDYALVLVHSNDPSSIIQFHCWLGKTIHPRILCLSVNLQVLLPPANRNILWWSSVPGNVFTQFARYDKRKVRFQTSFPPP